MDIDTLVTIGGIFILLVLSGIFSGSETALTAASQARMHLLQQQGDRRAGIVTGLFSQRERMIGAILLGNNLVNILASALATSLLIDFFGNRGVIYATAVMTLLVLVFGEVLPKTYAFYNADRVALKVAPAFRYIVALLSPITESINFVIRGTMRLVGVRIGAKAEEGHAEEALRGAIELHAGEEPDTHQERVMLRSILDLADVNVSEVMHHRQDIVMVDVDLPPGEIIDQVVQSPYTRIPLWRGHTDNIVGVLHAKALLRQVRAHTGDPEKIDIESEAATPWFIPESTSLLDQLQAFRQRREHFALVVDEYGSLMGVVTLEDILEEIVGDISDEHDVVPVGVRAQSDGSFLVEGRVTIRDLNRRFEWRLPDDDAATIAGLVIQVGRVIPYEGQIFMLEGFRFEVISRLRNRLALIRITPPAAATKAGSS
ncbi:MAG: HlyC/CorC family transporter [Proteobacteria bacterium]|nr:HlyC/CorC family transporter [Pseudomonadota bacterium]MDA1323652.1 HlyC/CorC family transporter [Pseudomonadota bacterium]